MPHTILNSKLLAAAMRAGVIDANGDAKKIEGRPGDVVFRDSPESLTFSNERFSPSKKEPDKAYDFNISKFRIFLKFKGYKDEEIDAILEYNQNLDLSPAVTAFLAQIDYYPKFSLVKKDFYRENGVGYLETIIKINGAVSSKTGETIDIPGEIICKYQIVNGKLKLINFEPTTDLIRFLIEKSPKDPKSLDKIKMLEIVADIKKQIPKARKQHDQYEAIENLLLQFESKIAAKRMDLQFAELCEQADVIKNQIKQLRSDPHVDRLILIETLKRVNRVAEDPTADNIKSLKTYAEDKVSKCHWGKIIGGALLMFASAVLVAASVAASFVVPVAVVGGIAGSLGMAAGMELIRQGKEDTTKVRCAKGLIRFGMFASNRVPEAGRAANVEDSTASKRSSGFESDDLETESVGSENKSGTSTPPSSIDSDDESVEKVVFTDESAESVVFNH